jgi:hypothetical protein
MTQQTFSIGRKPRVVISQGNGNLTVHSWKEPAIRVETEGSIAQLYQESDTLIITGCEQHLQLWVPYIRPGLVGMLGNKRIVTDISIAHQHGNVAIEDAGNVDLADITGSVEVITVEGNLQATNMSTLHIQKGVGGNAVLSNISRIETGAVGGSTRVENAETVTVGAVGGNLEADQIGARLQCSDVGGSCQVQDSIHAEVSIGNVGGSLRMTGIATMQSCNVGGGLSLLANLPPGYHTRIVVGGSADIALPDNPNLSIHVMAGGRISDETVGGMKRGNFATLVYGSGAARLDLTVGGSVRVLGVLKEER